MKTLVTGANGFIGSAVIRQLLNAGHEVRGLVRPKSNRRNLAGLPVEIVEGDLREPASLKNAVSGCEILFHIAADYRLWVPNPDLMYEINVNGTHNLMSAAANEDINKIIYTSSVATLGYNMNGTPANEDTPSSLEMMQGHYKRSKFLAEQEVLNFIKDHKLPIVIVNPSTPVGPGDVKPTPTGRIVLDTMCARMPAYVDTGLNIVHVDDVAHGHLLAYENGKFGERYILGGDNLSLKTILEEIDRITGKQHSRVRLPHDLVIPIAWLMELWAGITGREPRATIDGVKMSKKRMYFTSDKAKKQLGYESRPATEGIRDAITWFRENDYCT